VDARAIGVTGVSWGGFLACILAAADPRLAYAAPVYGCGFNHEPGGLAAGRPLSAKWASLWDPSAFLPRAKCPMLWVDGTNDFAFSLDRVRRSAALAPVPQAALDDPANFLTAPIGNGPFKMDGEWVADQYINPVRYDGYYGTPAKVDGIYFSIQKDPDTAFREFEAGNIDFTSIPSGRLGEVSEKYGVAADGYTATPGSQTLTGAEASIYYLAINVEDETMKDPDVRNAISLAVNRQNIVDTIFEGTRKPADCIFPPVIDEDPNNAWENSHYDLEAAAALLDKNYPADKDGKRDLSITLSYNSGGGHEDIMSIIQGDLEAIGITVTQEAMEWAAYLDALGDGNYQIGRLGWIADYPTMDNFLYPNFLSSAENNYSKYNNPEVDKALAEARQIVDDDERKQAYRAANALIGADMPIIPVMFYAHDHVASDRLASFFYDAQGKAKFVDAEMV
jgi:peptide/nickel transport system substrate-binding protein/oligopeptide transport system substrate-binding protein